MGKRLNLMSFFPAVFLQNPKTRGSSPAAVLPFSLQLFNHCFLVPYWFDFFVLPYFSWAVVLVLSCQTVLWYLILFFYPFLCFSVGRLLCWQEVRAPCWGPHTWCMWIKALGYTAPFLSVRIAEVSKLEHPQAPLSIVCLSACGLRSVCLVCVGLAI